MRYLRPNVLIALLLAAVLPSCGDDTSTLPDGVFRSVISIAVDPTPLPAGFSTTAIGYFNVSYKIIVTELSGLGGEFIYVNSTIFDEASGYSVAVNNYDTADMTVFIGSKRIEGGAIVEIPQQMDYLLPTGATLARIAIAVQLRDDRGNVINQSILLPITPVPVT